VAQHRNRSAHASGAVSGARLSGREREILALLANGQSGARIAEKLVLSPETVRTHIRNAMAKLGATSRAQAVALAVQSHEIDGQTIGEVKAAAPRPSGPPGGRIRPPATGRAGAKAALAAGRSDMTLTALLGGLVSLYDVEGGAVFLSEEDGLSLRRAALLGDGTARVTPERVPLGEGALGRAALERRAQLVHGSGSPDGGSGRATICAPMLASGRLVGVICLTTRPSRLTGRGELLLLQAFANRVGEILLATGVDHAGRLKQALERFRLSWSANAAS
jgi:DNA-binding CsgD family transcriptional regulator